ncbi:MAG: PAS domain S-box protein [Phycisphaerales bacterium]|nr:PAS domain S-box protein [Phycisphaerales bacterium]
MSACSASPDQPTAETAAPPPQPTPNPAPNSIPNPGPDHEGRYRAIVFSAIHPIVTIDATGIIREVNPAAERVFGYSPGALVGRNVSILMPEPHASSHGRYLVNYHHTGATNILGRPREFEGVRRDGHRFPIEISVARVEVPGQPGPIFTAIIRDISDRKRAESELRLLQELAVAIGQSRDLKSALTETLRRIGAATGWSYGEAWLPNSAGELVVDSPVWHAPGLPANLLDRLTRGRSLRRGEGLPGCAWSSRQVECFEDLAHEPRCTRAAEAGALGLNAAVAVPVLAGEEVVAVLVFLHSRLGGESQRVLELVCAAVAPLGPVIDRKRTEDELDRHRRQLESLVAERTAELERSHEQLRQADRLVAIGTLAAGLGHDMNNVLFPIRCRLDALDASKLTDEVREECLAIRRSVDYLQQLTDGLRLLALDPSDADASSASTDISDWWDQVGVLMRRALPRHAQLETRIPLDLPPVGVAPHRLTQAVLNLLSNAGAAIAREGHVRLAASAADDESTVRLAVSDDGCGMSDEVRRRALDPFFTTKKRGLGTGLGLSLVNGVALSAGGNVDIQSTPGRGTTVTLELPAVGSPPRPAARSRSASPPEAMLSVADPRTATLVAAFLRAAGYEVHTPPAAPGRSTRVLLTEPSAVALRSARQFLKGRPDRRVVLFGAGGPEWQRTGAIIIENANDFEKIRQGIADALSAVKEASP